MTDGYDAYDDDTQAAELLPPDTAGFYTSQLHDWVPLCPELKDSAIRLYWIMRALVIEKRGPVRKLTLRQLCYLLPAKAVKKGQQPHPSSLARIRSLLADLTRVGLITTPEGKRIKTSSRAAASAGPLRIRINERPYRGYAGPRNAFAALDAVRAPAAAAAKEAAREEAAREQARKAEKAAAREAERAGQISSPQTGAGQISSPGGQISSPTPSPETGADLREESSAPNPPFSPPAHTSRSRPPVRPSVSVGEGAREEAPKSPSTDGRTEQGRTIEDQDQEQQQPAASTATTSPGVNLLLSIGALDPAYLLTGQTLRDQGLMVTGMLDAGWKPQHLRQVITGRPLPDPLRTTVGGIISARLRAAAAGPPPHPAAGLAPVPPQTSGERVPDAPDRPVAEAVTRRAVPECPTCGDPAAPDHDLCPACLGWPECASGCGCRLPRGGTCPVCLQAEQEPPCFDPAPDEVCPGHHGTPCGRPVVTAGLCGRCRIAVEATREAAEALDGAATAL